MGVIARLRVLLVGTVTIGAVALIWAKAGTKLLNLAGSGGKHSGFLSNTVDKVGTVVPLLLSVFLLALVIWFIVASVQEERSVKRTR